MTQFTRGTHWQRPKALNLVLSAVVAEAGRLLLALALFFHFVDRFFLLFVLLFLWLLLLVFVAMFALFALCLGLRAMVAFGRNAFAFALVVGPRILLELLQLGLQIFFPLS